MKENLNKLMPGTFSFCNNCPYKNVCVSPFIEETGDFDEINEIDNKQISEGLDKLFDEIKNFKFAGSDSSYWTEELQECLLKKLTMAINLIGSANISINRAKDDKTVKQQ